MGSARRERLQRAVVITGASTGIGRCCALHLDQLGFDVFAGVRRQQDADALLDASETLRPILLDVVDEDQVLAARDKVLESGLALAGVVNNASVGPGGPLEFLPLDGIRHVVEVNLIGSISMTQRFLPLLRSSGGRVVFIGSSAGVATPPLVAPYAASKHGIEAIADAWRLELLPWNIKVSLVQPGAIATPIWEKGSDAVEKLRQNDPRVDELYRDALTALDKTTQQAARMGIPPMRVARAVQHALLARWPKPRYAVGLDAKLLTLLRPLIPDRIWDWLLVTAIGIPRRPPIALPAVPPSSALPSKNAGDISANIESTVQRDKTASFEDVDDISASMETTKTTN